MFCCYISTRSPPNPIGRNRWLEWCLPMVSPCTAVARKGTQQLPQMFRRLIWLPYWCPGWTTEFLFPALLFRKILPQRRRSLLEAHAIGMGGCRPLVLPRGQQAATQTWSGQRCLKEVKARKAENTGSSHASVFTHFLFKSYSFVKFILTVSLFTDKESPQRD